MNLDEGYNFFLKRKHIIDEKPYPLAYINEFEFPVADLEVFSQEVMHLTCIIRVLG